ncbi:MAG TPA: YcnI family protein [Actinomycetota bacterium]|nr:YcnI family protein [Actinomycetota bacterium]
MRIRWLWALLSITCLTLAMAGVAWAHVVVSPEEVPADEFEKLVVSVPTEKDIPTTGVRVEVPEGFTVVGVQPVPGWEYEFEEEGGVIRAITWSGGEIAPQEFQEFALQARTPEEPGEFAWEAFQTYADGSVVEWTGPEDAEEPASVVEVVADGGRSAERGAAEQGSSSEEPVSSGGLAQIAAYGGLGIGIVALIVALVALLRKT